MSFKDNDNTISYYYGFNEKPMEIRKKCESGFYIKKSNKNSITFDSGAYGSISEVCFKTDCKYVVKLISLSSELSYSTFLREALIAPIMAKYGIGPKIYDIFICLNAGYIIIEKWEGSIRKLLDSQIFTDDHLEIISNLIVKMHDKGVIHNDLHSANILYRKNNNKFEFSITDFGLSLYFEDKEAIIPNKFIPNKKSPDIFFPAFDFYKLNKVIETRRNIVFLPFFFIKGYMTILDNLLVTKFYTKSDQNFTQFSEFIKDIYLDKLKDKKINKIVKKSLLNRTISLKNNFKKKI